MELKFNIGAGKTEIPGFASLDLGDDIWLKEQKDNSVDAIYSSHFLEYFDYQEGRKMLESWYSKLLPEGFLYLGVPDFKAICDIYQKDGIILNGPLFGKMGTPSIYHRCVYDYAIFRHILYDIGFRSIEKVSEFELFCPEWGVKDFFYPNDCSQAKVDQKPISLNIVCRKY